MTRGRFTRRSLALGLFVLALGCNPSGTSTPPAPEPGPKGGPPPAIPETGPHAAGIRVFNAKCARCHVAAGGRKVQGPELTTVARDPAHTPEWLAEYIRDPKSKKPDARMPAQGMLSEDELKAVVDYLSTLK